jgi:hypothetical protein
MAIFTAAAAYIATAIASISVSSVAAFAARTLLTIGISKLISDRANKKAAGTQDVGARVQLPPSTNNKLPVVYGNAFVSPVITDAKISTDQKYMWYVCALAEVSDDQGGGGGSYTFGDIYYNGKLVTFDGTDTAKVVSLTQNSDPVQVDTKVNGLIYIYKFPDGSSSGISTGGSNAITLLSDSSTGGGIPNDLRWNSALYTTGGQTASMTNTAFIVVRLQYNTDASIQNLGTLSVELTNSLDKPGDCILDYLLNNRYGCAIPYDKIDTASLTALDNYSDQTITYTPVGGGSATQPRYRINGPINTGTNCLDNLQQLVDSCDSWLQYSELDGTWKVVINQSYTQAGISVSSMYQVTNSNLIGGIDINPIDLNSTYNELEINYPDVNIRDQVNTVNIELIDFAPEVMSLNEPINKLNIQYPLVNNFIQSKYLGLRRMLQSREDLVINFNLDYSGIVLEAGDLITVPFTPYGWEVFNSGYGKIFRVSQVQEVKLEDQNLGVRITAFEYNNTIYADNPIQDFLPENNTGLTDPNIISQPTAPVFATPAAANNATRYFTVSSNVSTTGTVMYMDFNYGNTSNTQQHVRYTSQNQANGAPYTANTTVSINVSDLAAGNYYWSATARNDFAGTTSNASANSYTWVGPSVEPFDPNTNTGGVTYSSINSDANPYYRIDWHAYAVADPAGNTVTLPIDIIGNSGLNVPYYIPGFDLPANYYYPYYQNTSSTANGYLANSTSQYYPATASYQVLTAGDDNFEVLSYINFGNTANYPLANDENFFISYDGVFTANTDTVIQIGAFYTTSTGGAYIFHDTVLRDTIILPANVPTNVTFEHGYDAAANNTLDGGGIIIRNITANSNAVGMYTKMEIFKYRD